MANDLRMTTRKLRGLLIDCDSMALCNGGTGEPDLDARARCGMDLGDGMRQALGLPLRWGGRCLRGAPASDAAKGGGPSLPPGFAFTATTLGQRAVVGPSKSEGHEPRLYARWAGGEYTFDDAPREMIEAVFAQPSTWPKGEELAALRAAKGERNTSMRERVESALADIEVELATKHAKNNGVHYTAALGLCLKWVRAALDTQAV